MDWIAAKARTFAIAADVFDKDEASLMPMTRGRDVNGTVVVDTARAGFGFLASIDLQPSNDALPRHASADPRARGNSVAYDAVLTALVHDWPWIPIRHDRIVIGAETFEIMAEEKDGSPRRAYYLNRVRG